MSVTLDEMKTYLRVDSGDEDALIESLLAAAKKLCMDVARCDSEEEFEDIPVSKIAVMFAAAYLFEHREEADHEKLTFSLRALLFADREEGF
jgi:uncharacterized phage protein (predicted DNA packaging)